MSTSTGERDAARDVLPVQDERSRVSRLEQRLPPLLSVIAGMVDLTGFFTLGNIFTAHITGNLVVASSVFVRGGAMNIAQLLAIPIAILALAAVWVFAQLSGRRGAPLARQLLVVQFLLLSTVLALSVIAHPSSNPHGLTAVITAMIAVCAMACQYALFRIALPKAVSTAVMTGNLTNAVLAFVDKFSPNHLMTDDQEKLKQSVQLLVGFLAGCVVAAAAIPILGEWVWLLPVALAAVAIVF